MNAMTQRLRLLATYSSGEDILHRLRESQYHQALQREGLELAATEIERLEALVAERDREIAALKSGHAN
jgi:hypothetical protein